MKKKIKIIIKRKNITIKTILWNGFSEDPNVISLTKFVETNSILIRSELIVFLNNLSSLKINQLNIKEYFLLEDDFSYWNLTNFEEKNIYKKNSFFEIAKIIAISKIFEKYKFDEIILVNQDQRISNLIEFYSSKKNILFNKKKNAFLFIGVAYNAVYKLYSLITFFTFLCKKTFFFKKFFIFNTNKNIFLSFFTYYNHSSLKKNIYISDFWGNLSNIYPANWLQFFFKTDYANTESKVQNLISKLNTKKKTLFQFLDSFYDLGILKQIFKSTLKIIFLSRKLKTIQLVPYKKNFNMWFFLENDFKNEFSYHGIANKLFFFYIFKKIFRSNSFKSSCFYIYENQPWEKSLIHHWKKNNSSLNKIFGVVSTSVRFWDIRYSLPSLSPNKILANGESSYSMLRDFGHKKENLDVVESLRYAKNSLQKNDNKNYNILILGDYSKSSNSNLIKIINSAKLSNKSIYFLKEHPLRSINCKEINLRIKKTSLSNMFFKIVITTNTTAAAIDHYLRGSQIITVLDDNNFNLSPLKNKKSVKFVRNGEELKDYITTYDKNNKNYDIDNFYLINSDLSRWNKYLI